MDFLQWLAGVSGDGIVGVMGGNTFLIIAFFLFGLAYFLIQADVSMPFAMMISFFALGVLVSILDNPNDPILNTGAKGFGSLIFLILVAMAGVLMWHLFFKKSQAGVG